MARVHAAFFGNRLHNFNIVQSSDQCVKSALRHIVPSTMCYNPCRLNPQSGDIFQATKASFQLGVIGVFQKLLCSSICQELLERNKGCSGELNSARHASLSTNQHVCLSMRGPVFWAVQWQLGCELCGATMALGLTATGLASFLSCTILLFWFFAYMPISTSSVEKISSRASCKSLKASGTVTRTIHGLSSL